MTKFALCVHNVGKISDRDIDAADMVHALELARAIVGELVAAGGNVTWVSVVHHDLNRIIHPE